MYEYPRKGYIQDEEDYIIVNLGAKGNFNEDGVPEKEQQFRDWLDRCKRRLSGDE
jgi:hypothetical protein